jgi:hypothetical protein
MATNPRIPERRDLPTLHDQRRAKNGLPLLPLGILVAALLMIALIAWIPRTFQSSAPRSAPVLTRADQIRLSDFRLSPSAGGDQLSLYGKLFNGGETTIYGVRARVTFSGADGETVAIVTAPIEAMDGGIGRSLGDVPVKAQQTHDIRINIKRVPEGWNHQPPSIAVDQITAQGSK